jgi:hypothetical protein
MTTSQLQAGLDLGIPLHELEDLADLQDFLESVSDKLSPVENDTILTD